MLTAGKTLLTPQPRLRTGFFSTLAASDLPTQAPGALLEACTSAGAAKYGRPVPLLPGGDAAADGSAGSSSAQPPPQQQQLKVDLLVVGSSAVCSSTGARLGKGEVCSLSPALS